MKSKDRAKERLKAETARLLEPYKEVLKDADIQCDLERKLDKHGNCFPFPEKEENRIEMEKQRASGEDIILRVMEIKRAVADAGEAGQVLHTEIARLTDELTAKEMELVLTQQQLIEAQASNANWREQYMVTIERMEKGRTDEIVSWRGKVAHSNMLLDRCVRENHNRDAFAEAGK